MLQALKSITDVLAVDANREWYRDVREEEDGGHLRTRCRGSDPTEWAEERKGVVVVFLSPGVGVGLVESRGTW